METEVKINTFKIQLLIKVTDMVFSIFSKTILMKPICYLKDIMFKLCYSVLGKVAYCNQLISNIPRFIFTKRKAP